MHGIDGDDEKEGTEMNDQASHIGDIAIPYKYIIFITTDLEALEQAEQAAECLNIDYCLYNSQL